MHPELAPYEPIVTLTAVELAAIIAFAVQTHIEEKNEGNLAKLAYEASKKSAHLWVAYSAEMISAYNKGFRL